MRLVRVLWLSTLASGLMAQTVTWDSNGNGMLNGTYYFRHVLYQLGGQIGIPLTGALSDAVSLYGTLSFSGNGTYTGTVTRVDLAAQSIQSGTLTPGTYSIAASGHGFLTNPLSPGDFIYGLVNAQGIFVGSSTENRNYYNDLFIAAPLASATAGVGTFKGAYSVAYMDLSSGSPQTTIGGILTMNPDGAGNLPPVGFAGYQGSSSKAVLTMPTAKYIFSGGAAKLTFPSSNTSTALLQGDYYLYFSPDGNFVFGGAPNSADLMVGVRTGNNTPSLSGLYYEAGLDQNEAGLLITGAANTDTFYGSFNAGGGAIVGHERLLSFFNSTTEDYTYSDSYTVPSNGIYSGPATNYVVSNGVRIASGIGPYLSIGVALQAPTVSPSLSTTGVFLNPTGIVNAASFAPFTAGIAPGEFLTLFGINLASGSQTASSLPFPPTLGKVQVMINNIPAPVYYVTPGQLAAIVPYGVTGSIATVQVINNNVASNAVTVYVNKTAPGVFTQTSDGLGYGAMLHLDNSVVTAANPAKIGETVSVYVSGLGAVSPAIADGAAGPTNPLSETPKDSIAVYIGGVQATVAYSGLAPTLGGLYQINFTVPTGLTAGDHTLDIAGPDAYSSECLIAIAGASTASPEAVRVHRRPPTIPTRR